MLLASAVAIAAATFVAGPVPGATANSAFPDLPNGFAKVQLASGLANPTAIAFGPNGDIYDSPGR